MKQPHICKLSKDIYGLRQAPRAWYSTLSSFLVTFGFINSTANKSLFIFSSNNVIVYILVYVDDIIITKNNKGFLEKCINALSTRFSLRELGNLNFFHGIEIIRDATGLVMTQSKYIRDILEKTNMIGSKAANTPMASTTTLSLFGGLAAADAEEFRKAIGSLQYLLITRPDISFSVNKKGAEVLERYYGQGS